MRPVTGSSASQVNFAALPSTLPLGHRRLAVMWVVLHPPAARFIKPAEWQLDGALVVRRRALNNGPVGFVDRSRFEQLAELRQRLAMAAEHQAAGGVAVEPMRQRRRSRQSKAQRVEMVLQAFATLVPLLGPRCTANPAGLSSTSISPSR